MATIEFPKISNPSYPLKIEREDNSITSKFEDGSMQSRRKFTRSRRKFTLNWNSLPQSEFEVLDKFITETVSFAAKSFNWTNPTDNKKYEVRCTKYGDATLDVLNYWKIDIEFTEV